MPPTSKKQVAGACNYSKQKDDRDNSGAKGESTSGGARE